MKDHGLVGKLNEGLGKGESKRAKTSAKTYIMRLSKDAYKESFQGNIPPTRIRAFIMTSECNKEERKEGDKCLGKSESCYLNCSSRTDFYKTGQDQRLTCVHVDPVGVVLSLSW